MPRPANPDDAAAKLEIMKEFFDYALRRVDYLNELHKSGHKEEALTLCLVYIDGFAQWLHYSSGGTSQNFVETLCAHDAYVSLIHPLQMIRALSVMNGEWPARANKIESIFQKPPYELMDRLTFARSLSSEFRPRELRVIQREFWRGTIAAVAYYWLRNPMVHRFGSFPFLSFSSTLYQGNEPPALGLAILIPPLKSMISEARTRSMNSCEWFGDDRIIS